MAEFETGTPSVRQVQGLIKDGKEVEIKLLTQDVMIGQLTWQDQHCLCLVTHDGIPTIIWRHAIAYVRPQEIVEGSRALQVKQ